MIKRTNGIKQLQKLFEEEGSRLVYLYGTKRSEKEELIRQFLVGKKFFYYCARNASAEEQRACFCEEIERQYEITLEKKTYDACFAGLESGDTSKFVIVIDEFERIAKKEPEFFDSLILLKEGKLYMGEVMVLLFSSSLTWSGRDMEKTLGDKVKSIDMSIHLEELSFLDIVRTFPDYSVKECVQLYGIVGGVPAYLNLWDPKKTIKQNVCDLILRINGALQTEAEDYVASELRELSVYDTILSAMAQGNEKLNDLYRKTGYSRAKISVYLKNLAAFDIVEKINSFETGGWDNAKKGVYRISHHLVDFWFTFVYPHLSDVVIMEPENFYEMYIRPDLDHYLRPYFVGVCREYLSLMNMVGKVPIKIERMGTWVGKEGTIDIIGQDSVRDNVVGICNWEEDELSYASYQKLLEDMKSARIHAKTIYLFSARSFEVKLKALEHQSNSAVVLVDMTEL